MPPFPLGGLNDGPQSFDRRDETIRYVIRPSTGALSTAAFNRVGDMKLSQFADMACNEGNGYNGSASLALGAAQSDFCLLVRDATAPVDLPHPVAPVHAESSTVPAGAFAALRPQRMNTFTHADGTTLAFTGTDWMNVATVEFPLFSGRLSILIC